MLFLVESKCFFHIISLIYFVASEITYNKPKNIFLLHILLSPIRDTTMIHTCLTTLSTI